MSSLDRDAIVTAEPNAPPRASATRLIALAAAVASPVIWFSALLWIHPGPIADERIHARVIAELQQGHWPARGEMPVLPTYHLLAAAVAGLCGGSLLVLRSLSMLCTLAALLLVYGAARSRHGQTATEQLLLWVWNPLYFPDSVLVYTEPLAMLALTAALWCHVHKRTVWAAAALLLACFVRQSNIVWVALFAAWVLTDELDAVSAWAAARGARSWMGPCRRALRRAWPYGLALAAFGAFLLHDLPWALAPTDWNRAGVNSAQFYAFGFAVVVLWAPLWVQRGRALWSARLAPALGRGLTCAVLVAAVGALGVAYANQHPCNTNPNFLHDRFVTFLQTSAPARYAVAALIVAVAPLVALHAWSQPARYTVLAAWVFAVLFLSPHSLVEHRYYIFPFMFIHFATDYTPRQLRPLCAWSALLSLAMTTYLALCGGPYSGL